MAVAAGTVRIRVAEGRATLSEASHLGGGKRVPTSYFRPGDWGVWPSPMPYGHSVGAAFAPQATRPTACVTIT
jgi:hypothetical protein